MKRFTLGLVVWTPLLAGMLACATTKAPAQVDNSSLALLNEQQMQPVDDARIESGRARDLLAKAKGNEQEAKAGWDAAKADREVAVAQLGRAKAETDLLRNQKPDPATQRHADDDAATAGDRLTCANLKLDYVNRMMDISHVDAEAAEQHVRVVEASMERAKYQALKAARPNDVAGINGAVVDQQLAGAQVIESQLRKTSADKRVEALEAYNRWQQLDARLRNMPAPQQQPVQQPVSMH